MSSTDPIAQCPKCFHTVTDQCFNCKSHCVQIFKDCNVCYLSVCNDNIDAVSGDSSNQYVIIGAVAGSLGLVAIVIFVWLMVRARKRKKLQEDYLAQTKVNQQQRNASISLVEDSAFGIQSIFNNNDSTDQNSSTYIDSEGFLVAKPFRSTQISTQRTSLFGSLGNGKGNRVFNPALSSSSIPTDKKKLLPEAYDQPDNNFEPRFKLTQLSNRDSTKQDSPLSPSTQLENFYAIRDSNCNFETKDLPTPPGVSRF